MKSIIMAGGSGTRLWPLSRKKFPKQFLSIVEGLSFLQLTARRLAHFTEKNEIYVVSGGDYRHTVIDHMTRLFSTPYQGMIVEPCGRNTAPAIALTMKYLMEKEGAGMDEVLFFSPSDHIIQPETAFAETVKKAVGRSKDSIVTFGIAPDKPETGYGYIELGKELGGGHFQVARFVEKPDQATAQKYVDSGKYMWNAGMFMFSIGVMLEAFRQYCPELYTMVREGSLEAMLSGFSNMPNISIDYAVMVKANNIVCAKMPVNWNDVGSWDSLFDVYPRNADNNATSGDVLTIDTKDSLIISDKKLTTLIGLSSVAVIETEDAILVCDRARTQKVKDMVGLLKEKKRRETEEHMTTYRPWGNYTILEDSKRYKIKKIVVNVGQTLSLQRHSHRSEHWVVVSGTAQVKIGDKETYVHENESAFVPKSVIHRLHNPGKVPLEIIEVQNGEYLGEDDIERLEDIYGRS